MNDESKIILDAISEHYGAAIAMLKKDLKSCPDKVWDDRTNGPPFWHVAYHVMWFLDWYLSDSKEARENFKSKFGEEPSRHLNESPEITLTPNQLLEYLSDIKQKAKIIGFNIDPKFNNALDGLMILDLYDVPVETITSLSKEINDDSILERFFINDFNYLRRFVK